jgi:hypothetical protein
VSDAFDDEDMAPILPHEFQPAELSARIVLGAVAADPVRLHGAITAALEIHGTYTARHTIFAAALDEAADHSPAARDVVAAAIRRHMAAAA